MPHTHLEPETLPVRRLWLFGGGVLFGLAGGHHIVPGVVLEGALLGLLLWALAGFAPLVARVRAVPASYRRFALGLVFFLVLGQVVKETTYTYPFAKWTMYGAVRSEDPLFYEYYALRSSGAEEVFNPATVIRPLKRSRMTNLLTQQIDAVRAAEDADARARHMRLHEATLRALARLRDEEGRVDPILSIRVVEGQVPLRSYAGEQSLQRRPLWKVDTTPSP